MSDVQELANAFSGHVARSLFGLDVPPERRVPEARHIGMFSRWVHSAGVDRAKIMEKASDIDRVLIGAMSAASMREVAAMVLDRCPDAIYKMPNLQRHSAVLEEARTLAGLFDPVHLSALARALSYVDKGE